MTLDELGEYGMAQLNEEEIERFLGSHSLGVLGLSTENGPYMLPMSYGYDGGTRLYFFYVVGEKSKKETLSKQAESASFLVYSAETMFNWRSVFLNGKLRKLPEDKRATLSEQQHPKWRPELFTTASEDGQTQLYEFRIKDWTGITHTGLPPSFY